MKYPVFMGQAYAYNNINIGDSYNLSNNLIKAGNPYGLDSTKTNSHQMKNSEWGALAYLSHSSYGYKGGDKLYINNVNLNNKVSTVYAVTGYAGQGTDTAENSFSSVPTLGDSISSGTYTSYAWYTSNGKKGSSTQNITGVYDVSGCLTEYISGFIANSNSCLTNYGGTLYSSGTTNTKLKTIYPYTDSGSSNEAKSASNWTAYYNSKTETKGFGDSILEISNSGGGKNSWNGDNTFYPSNTQVFFGRTQEFDDSDLAGIFQVGNPNGSPWRVCGFRPVLIVE